METVQGITAKHKTLPNKGWTLEAALVKPRLHRDSIRKGPKSFRRAKIGAGMPTNPTKGREGAKRPIWRCLNIALVQIGDRAGRSTAVLPVD